METQIPFEFWDQKSDIFNFLEHFAAWNRLCNYFQVVLDWKALYRNTTDRPVDAVTVLNVTVRVYFIQPRNDTENCNAIEYFGGL